MNLFRIPALVATAAISFNAFADNGWHEGHRHQRHHRHSYPVERVVVQRPVYVAPRVVYEMPPPVVYRERVIYRETPVYYEAPPRYAPPPPPVYRRPAPAPVVYGGDRMMGQAIGAIAGGVIGNQFGQGNGKVVSTAAGAVIGSMVGGNIATYGY